MKLGKTGTDGDFRMKHSFKLSIQGDSVLHCNISGDYSAINIRAYKRMFENGSFSSYG